MPFFFFVPIWLLCVMIGLLTLPSSRFRFLASYMILGSTFGLVVSFVLSTGALVLLPKFLAMIPYDGSLVGVVTVLGYLAAVTAGALAGIVGGGLIAYRLNRWAGLTEPSRPTK